MEKNDEILLQELNEILPVGVKDLRTLEEKNAEIDRIIDIWSKLSENAQTEELFFKVVERTKNSWSGKYSIKNPKNVLKVYGETSEHLKNRDIYVRLISLIQKDFLMFEIKELYDSPYRPFDFETEQDYFDMAVVFENYYSLTDFIEKYVPENVRTQEFYQKIFQRQNDFEKGYGGNAVGLWNTFPENVKNQELLVELCRRINLAEIKKLFKIIPEDYINKELLDELPGIFKYKMLIPEYVNEILGRFPEELKNQEFYSKLVRTIYNPEERLLVEYEIISAYVDIVPAKYKTVNLFGDVIRHVGTTQITRILDNTPDEIKTQEFYIEFMKAFAESQTIRDLTGYSLYAKILRKIPTEYFTEENILLMLSQKGDKPKDGVGLLKTVEKFCKEELSSLYPNGFSKDFYTQLIENNLEDEIFSIFNSMPDKYKTEEMYLKSIEKNKENNGINLHLIFTLSRRLSGDKNLSKTFSKNFYEQLIYSTNDASHMIYIINEMPDEYKTEDLYMKLIARYKEDDKINGIIHGMPENLKTQEMYKRIIEEVKTVQNENGQIRGNNQKILEKIIGAIPEEIRNQEEVIDSFSNFLDEKGNTIYTPANLLYLYRQPFNYKYRPYIEKKLLQILNMELERVEKIITSESNIEDEINKIQGIDMGVEQPTFIHGLNIIFEVIPKDSIPEELKRKYYLTIKQSIVKLENEHNRKVIEILPQMFESNDELFASLDKRFIESDKYINSLGVEKFEILALYPKIQREIVKLDDVQLNIFSNILNYIAEKNIGEEVQKDWISMTEKILVNIRNPEFEKLIKNLQSVAPADLSDTMKENLSSILSKKINYFDIDEFEQLESYKDISKRTCFQILRNPEDNSLNKKIKRIPKNERIKFAKLQLLFGIDIQEAKFLIEKYGYEITDEMAKDETFKCLKQIKEIIETENVENLLVQSEDDSNETQGRVLINTESLLRDKLKKLYKRTLYSLKEHEEDRRDDIVAEYNGYKAQVYMANSDFNMCIHALGAYSGKKARDNYVKDWNIAKMKYHGLCTSYIGNNSISTARVPDVIYGFDIPEDVPLLLSAPWDIGSNIAYEQFATAITMVRTKFLNPTMQINCTRHTHNEMVYDRREHKKGIISKKMQPSYIVYIPDYLQNKKPEEIKKILSSGDLDALLKEFMEKDSLWEKTQKAAVEFGVPIVIVDRVRHAKREHEKIEDRLKQFEESRNPSLLSGIITEFENNRTGNRDYHNQVCASFFSEKMINTYIQRITAAIDGNKGDAQQQLENYEELIEIISRELENRNSFGKTSNDKIEQYWSAILPKIETKRNTVAKKVKGLEDKKPKNEIESILDEFRKSNQFPESIPFVKKDIYEQIQDMKNMNLYGDKLIHSDRHIQNVMIFSSILASMHKLTEDEKMLLIEAAKFHDSGRTSDGHKEHAVDSANIAGKMLKRVYSAEDLKIIQIAIEYHEMDESLKGCLDEEKLLGLFTKYGLDSHRYDEARRISAILKDADALDRTRFVENGALRENFLHSMEAKEMVRFAKAINEEYARNDIEDMIEINEGIKDSIKDYMERTKRSFLQTLRDIRTRKFIPKKSKAAIEAELKQNATMISPEEILETMEELVDTQKFKPLAQEYSLDTQ